MVTTNYIVFVKRILNTKKISGKYGKMSQKEAIKLKKQNKFNLNDGNDESVLLDATETHLLCQ